MLDVLKGLVIAQHERHLGGVWSAGGGQSGVGFPQARGLGVKDDQRDLAPLAQGGLEVAPTVLKPR